MANRRKKSVLPLRDVINIRSLPNIAPEIEKIMHVWDGLDSAINAVVCASPALMTSASAKLEEERRKMREAINSAAWNSIDPDTYFAESRRQVAAAPGPTP